MAGILQTVEDDFGDTINETDIRRANDQLRSIALGDGLGVAILVAWRHGLKHRHILEGIPERSRRQSARRISTPLHNRTRRIDSDTECPYVFVNVPIRRIRNDIQELQELEILNDRAEPSDLVYHEDGIIGAFSFTEPRPEILSNQKLHEMLRELADSRLLSRASLNSRQIHFKDLDVRDRIDRAGEAIYVRLDNRPLTRENLRLPIGLDTEEVWNYVAEQIAKRNACNYCSVETLCLNEVTLQSETFGEHYLLDDVYETERNYQFGFTYSPFGDPRSLCHFLAWDYPSINDVVNNMDPQTYSFTDLIRLVRRVNWDIHEYGSRRGAEDLPKISGGCNHWAGNSIYHQHYQFLIPPAVPLLDRNHPRLASTDEVDVFLAEDWPVPAILIKEKEENSSGEAMAAVAERVARQWSLLNSGEDLGYGNHIRIPHHTQNIFVTHDEDGQLMAAFFPRDRLTVDAASEQFKLEKRNAGVLEMIGYFIVDDTDHFETIEAISSAERNELGSEWLRDLAPDSEIVDDFTASVVASLVPQVSSYIDRIERELQHRSGSMKVAVGRLMSAIRRDGELTPDERELLHRHIVHGLIDRDTEERAVAD